MKYDIEYKKDYKKNHENAFEMKDRKCHSNILANSLGRSGQRALLHTAGMDEEDMRKSSVAIIGSFSEIVPGHVYLRRLAEYVKQGIMEAGGIPGQSETVAICDGLCQGHKGTYYPLTNKDLIADSVEMVAEAHHFDVMVLLSECDETILSMLMAAARLDIPAAVVPGGPMLPGNVGNNPLFCSSEFREYPGYMGVRIAAVEETKEAEKAAPPTVRSCTHLRTANFMYMLTEVLGMVLPGAGTAPAVPNKRKRIAKASSRCMLELLRKGITPRKILTRESMLSGVAGAMATSSSTNLILHLMVIVHGAGVKLGLENFDRISRQVPFVCNLQPSGKYPIISLSASGGISAVLKTIENRIHGDILTVTDSTLRELLQQVKAAPDGALKNVESPQKPEGGITMLRGNLAPRGTVVKQSGIKSFMYHFEGKVCVFNSMEETDEAISNNTVEKGTVIVIRYEEPEGGPGMKEMFSTTAPIMGWGMDEDYALVIDGHLPGAIYGPRAGYVSPEAASGGPAELVKDGDVIEIDIAGRSLYFEMPQGELEKRKMILVPVGKPRKPALARYTALVSSADTGTVINVTGP